MSDEAWLITVWNLDWTLVLEMPLLCASRLSWVEMEPCASIDRFPQFVFHCPYFEHQTMWHCQSVNLLLSGYHCGRFTSFDILWDDLISFMVLRFRFGTFWQTTTTDLVDKCLWNETKVNKTVILLVWKTEWVERHCWKCCLLFFFAEPRLSFGPKEQHISGVSNYLLLTMCQVHHCIIRVFSFILKMSQGQTL